MDRGPEVAAREARAVLLGWQQHLDRRMAFLGTLGNNAPFLGLFGTVLGIIRAFHDLSLDTKGGANVVMAGISEALIERLLARIPGGPHRGLADAHGKDSPALDP